MSKLPRLSRADSVKALWKVGFTFKHQKGTHIILRRENPFASSPSAIIRNQTGELIARLSVPQGSARRNL
jgi:hypothetical protein